MATMEPVVSSVEAALAVLEQHRQTDAQACMSEIEAVCAKWKCELVVVQESEPNGNSMLVTGKIGLRTIW